MIQLCDCAGESFLDVSSSYLNFAYSVEDPEWTAVLQLGFLLLLLSLSSSCGGGATAGEPQSRLVNHVPPGQPQLLYVHLQWVPL